MTKRLYRLGMFAGEQLAQDTGVPESLALDQRADLLSNQLEKAGSFVSPELLSIGAAKIKKFMAQDPGLRIHAFPINRVLRQAPHTLDNAGQPRQPDACRHTRPSAPAPGRGCTTQ